MRLGWDFVMTTSEEERDREPPDRGQETTRNAQADTSGFAAQAPREEGEAADTAQERAQPRSEQAGSGDAGDTHQEYLTNWARAHQYPIPDTQKYEDERKFLMSSLESLIVTTKKTQDSLAEVARRQQDAYEGACNSEQVVHDMDKTLDRLAGEMQNVNRRFDSATTTQANDINVLKAKVKVPDPPKFKGPPQQYTFWIHSVECWLEAGRVPEGEKVIYAQGHLEGEASQYWLSTAPLIRKEGRNPHDFAEFKKALNTVYGHADQEHKAREALDSLRQGAMTAEAYVQKFIDLLSKIDAKADECMTAGEKIHRFRQGLRVSLKDKLAIDHTTGERFKDFGKLVDVCIKLDDTHKGAQVASLAGGASDSQAGPSSPTWPSLRSPGQNKRAWGDVSDDGSSRSGTPGRGRGPPPGISRGRGFGRGNQYTQGRGYVQQPQPRPPPGTGRYGELPWRAAAHRQQLMLEGRCLKCEQLGHRVGECRSAPYNSQGQTHLADQGQQQQGAPRS